MTNAAPGPSSDLGPARLVGGTLALLIAAAALFLAFPALDLVASGIFYDPAGSFSFGASGPGRFLRASFNALFAAGCAGAGMALAVSLFSRMSPLGLGPLPWAYVALCLAVGPGLVTNLILKDNWGRARPVQVEAFGGEQSFTPPLLVAEECERNCSFVSGEASSIFMLFFALAMVFPAWRGRLYLAGLLAGTAAGIVRMAAGGHFLSDVIFAGLFMALTAQVLYLALPPQTGRSGWSQTA